MKQCSCGFCKDAYKVLGTANGHPFCDTSSFNLEMLVKGPINAQIMVIQFPTGEYLVRYMVPAKSGGTFGKYSEGTNMNYNIAVAAALAGLK